MTDILAQLINRLTNKHNCHTIILYGSHVRGDASPSSDYDLCAFRTSGDTIRDCANLEGVLLDAWIYPDNKLKEPDETMLHVRNGKVIKQQDQLGSEFLQKLAVIFSRGPKPLPDWEVQVRLTWMQKCLERARKQDIEGNYRLSWLLFESLEYYFQLRNMWYLGSKESFAWLSANDSATYELFNQSLKNPHDLDTVERLVAAVAGVHPQ